jgi:hypothetical protein
LRWRHARGAELFALCGYNVRAMQTKKERLLARGSGTVDKTRIYFRWFEAGVALLGGVAFAAVGRLVESRDTG